ncbi:hypothetical protein K402DRAFT_321910, partial [Aulographum hederae CBS 113979]
DTSDVHLGHWINWSKGPIQGSTLTLTRSDGTLLTAFIAVFVSYVSTRAWRIVCFAVHLMLFKETPQDAVYHQRQVLLRNSTNADAAIWDLGLIAQAWRRQKASSFVRILPFILLATVFGLGFAAAGIFTSQISLTTGNEVLLSGSRCAFFGAGDGTTTFTEYEKAYLPYVNRISKAAAQRAQQCFREQSTKENCPTFVKWTLPFTTERNAPCPFADRVCRSNNSNLIIESGYLNSHFDFGINSSPEDRFEIRHRLHCAPLAFDGYVRMSNIVVDQDGSHLNASAEMIQFRYGTRFMDEMGPENLTYQYPVRASENETDAYRWNSNAGIEYGLRTFLALYNNTSPQMSDFVPIPDLVKEDADTIVIFLNSNSIQCLGEIDDPWFSAHIPAGSIRGLAAGGDVGNTPVFYADNAASAVGCAAQLQYCNPNLPREKGCTPYMGPIRPLQGLAEGTPPFSVPLDDSIWQNDRHKEIFATFHMIITHGWTIHNVIKMGIDVLIARDNMAHGIQTQLPSNQWQEEIEYWQAIALAAQQRWIVEYANGPRVALESLDRFLSAPNGDVQQHLCQSQKVLSSDYSSFSVLGLGLTLGIGILLILLSFFLEPLASFFHRRWRHGKNGYALLEWSVNETFQLHRATHENIGSGTWKTTFKGVPVTHGRERLDALDVSDPQRPRLKSAPCTWETLAPGGGGGSGEKTVPNSTSEESMSRTELEMASSERSEISRLSDEEADIGVGYTSHECISNSHLQRPAEVGVSGRISPISNSGEVSSDQRGHDRDGYHLVRFGDD